MMREVSLNILSVRRSPVKASKLTVKNEMTSKRTYRERSFTG
jgi:hypothetical protein